MENLLLYPLLGSFWLANLAKTALDDSTIHLFKSGLVVGPTTTRAELLAEECDFSGYDDAGIAITEFGAPILAPEGGVAIQSPLVQWTVSDPATVQNLVGGWWLETAGVTPAVVVIGSYAVAVPMQVPNAGITIAVRLLYGATV